MADDGAAGAMVDDGANPGIAADEVLLVLLNGWEFSVFSGNTVSSTQTNGVSAIPFSIEVDLDDSGCD
jgi:hypothetical protein